jgi:DNA-binding NtrC family response regulator
MKTILLVCDHSNIDGPLRRSLAHLVKCCEINIIPDGYQAFNELSVKAFDLIIIDFESPGADALELVESVQYIDPGVPVILLLKQEHKLIWDTARHLKAHPLIRPFKPLKFLRRVDKLLHKQLNRYRHLAEDLHQTLETLRKQTEAACTFPGYLKHSGLYH